MIQIDIEPIWRDEVQQQIFRHLLSSNSLPGSIAALGSYIGQDSALMGVLATILDNTTLLYDRDRLLTDRNWRRLDVRAVPLAEANFIVAEAAIAPAADFIPNLGTLSSPELGATLILLVERLGAGSLMLELKGPGIDGQRTIVLDGCDRHGFDLRAEWVVNFPMGVDLILVDETQVMSLPRTTQIAIVS